MAKRKTQSETGLERAALEVWRVYKFEILQTRTRRSLTGIARAGVELDAIRCYLREMTGAEIITWLKENKKVTIAKSVMGRFCRDLFRLGATRFGVAKKQPAEDAGNEEV